MPVPEQTHSGSLNRSKVDARPEAGARRPQGKTDSCDEALGKPDGYKPEAVTTLPVEGNDTKRQEAIDAQNNGNVLVVTEKQEKAIVKTREALNKRSV